MIVAVDIQLTFSGFFLHHKGLARAAFVHGGR